MTTPNVTLIKFEMFVDGEHVAAGFTTSGKIDRLLQDPGTLGRLLRGLRDSESAETVLLDPCGHRFFFFWCPNCATRVEVETAEERIDDSRDVDIMPDTEIPCPMCAHLMWTWDEVALRDESFMNRGTWVAFERWRRTKQEAPSKAHVLLVPEEHLTEVADIIEAGIRERRGGGTSEIQETPEQWVDEYLRQRGH